MSTEERAAEAVAVEVNTGATHRGAVVVDVTKTTMTRKELSLNAHSVQTIVEWKVPVSKIKGTLKQIRFLGDYKLGVDVLLTWRMEPTSIPVLISTGASAHVQVQQTPSYNGGY